MWLRSTRRTKPASTGRPRHFRPQVQILEDRCCPSGGALNQSFGSGGIDGNIPATSVAVQSNGDLVSIGTGGGFLTYHMVVTRVTPTGALDTSFNGSGTVTISTKAFFGTWGDSVLIQPDGKILVGGVAYTSKFNPGESESVTARLNTDGSLDKSFGHGGIFTWEPTGRDSVSGLALLANGDILATGNASLSGDSYALFRLTPGGKVDTTFGNQGNGLAAVHVGILSNTADSPAGAIVQASNGDIYLCGSDSKGDADLVAFTSSGSVDISFGSGNGYIEYAPPTGYSAYGLTNLALQGSQIVGAGVLQFVGSDGKTYSRGVLARYSLSGALDTGFGNSTTPGYYITTFLGSFGPVTLAADGSIIVAGAENYLPTGSTTYASEMVVGHLSANGVPDTTFGSDGSGFVAIQAVANGVQNLALDGSDIVLAGGSTLVEVTAP
jgi:uncharacterized delta-60 repeat protein